MFISGPLGPMTLFADENDNLSCGNVLENPAAKSCYFDRIKKEKGTDIGQDFGANEATEAAQDLYLRIVDTIEFNPEKEAIELTAQKYNVSPKDMSAIVSGSITPILDKYPTLRIDQAQRIYAGVIEAYQNNLNNVSVKARVEARTEPNEIFANGDLRDSGFDLMVDLENIEIILFKRADPRTINTGVPRQKSDGDGGSGSDGGVPEAEPVDEVDLNSPAAYQVRGDDERNEFNVSPASGDDPTDPFFGGINPNQCFTPSNYQAALNNFSNTQAGQNTGGSPDPTRSRDRTPSAASPVAIENVDFEQDLHAGEVQGAEVPSAAADDWRVPEVCGEIFCLSLEFIMKPAEASYTPYDNCIDCHVEFINEAMDETISHNLIPAKVPGNLGESSLCKDAAGISLGRVGLNVAYSTQPIVTPAKDDLVDLSSIGEEWNRYVEKNSSLHQYFENLRRELEAEESGEEKDATAIMSEAARQTLIAIENAEDDAAQAEVWKRAIESMEAVREMEAKLQAIESVGSDSYKPTHAMTVLADEMAAMNVYFEGMQKMFKSLNEDVPGMNSSLACSLLKEKRECN